jgi:hypothetical protein
MALTLSPLGVEENHNVIRYNLCIFSRRKSYLDRNVHLFYIKYQKYILPDDKQFWNIARDEAIYRLDENLSRFAGLVPPAPRSGGLSRYAGLCGIKR